MQLLHSADNWDKVVENGEVCEHGRLVIRRGGFMPQRVHAPKPVALA
jgi:hypothetical protein